MSHKTSDAESDIGEGTCVDTSNEADTTMLKQPSQRASRHPNLQNLESQRRLECLIYDFRRFDKDSEAKKRVERAGIHPFSLGPPYMPVEMGQELLNSTTDGITLQEFLGDLVQRKGYQLCTSHTLGPAMMTFFKIETDFENDAEFRFYYYCFISAAQRCKEGVFVSSEMLAVAEPKAARMGQGKSKKKRNKRRH